MHTALCFLPMLACPSDEARPSVHWCCAKLAPRPRPLLPHLLKLFVTLFCANTTFRSAWLSVVEAVVVLNDSTISADPNALRNFGACNVRCPTHAATLMLLCCCTMPPLSCYYAALQGLCRGTHWTLWMPRRFLWSRRSWQPSKAVLQCLLAVPHVCWLYHMSAGCTACLLAVPHVCWLYLSDDIVSWAWLCVMSCDLLGKHRI